MSYYDGPSGPSTNYAKFEWRSASLCQGQFGVNMCAYFLGLSLDLVEALVGRYVRGDKKGQLRGTVEWEKCVHGGWVSGRGICGPGVVSVQLVRNVGWDHRHARPITETLVEWTRKGGIDYNPGCGI